MDYTQRAGDYTCCEAVVVVVVGFLRFISYFVSNLMRWLLSDGRIYRRALLLRAPIVRTRYCHIANFGIPHINYLEIMFFYNKLNKHQKGKTIDFL